MATAAASLMVMMATTTVAASSVSSSGGEGNNEEDVATTALVAYLRSEADLSDLKAASLRAQARALAAQYGVTDELQQRYGTYIRWIQVLHNVCCLHPACAVCCHESHAWLLFHLRYRYSLFSYCV